MLGYLYHHGQGVPEDLEECFSWYFKAVEGQGAESSPTYIPALNNLGRYLIMIIYFIFIIVNNIDAINMDTVLK